MEMTHAEMRFAIEDMGAEGDRVAVRAWMRYHGMGLGLAPLPWSQQAFLRRHCQWLHRDVSSLTRPTSCASAI
jgi:hypothetical protein